MDDFNKNENGRESTGATILAVDDSALVLKFIEKELGARHNVVAVSSAKDAYAAMEEQVPDLILLDLEMPGEDGFCVLTTLRASEKYSGIPVIFFTDKSLPDREEKAFNLGASDYIHKPITGVVLNKRVELHLDRIKYYKSLENQVSRAEEIAKIKNRFLASMSHEIRTPMNAILGITESFVQNKKLAPDVAEAFNRIFSSANTLLRIINDILDLSKIESGKLEVFPSKYDLPGIICDTAQLNLLYLDSGGVEFKIDLDENAPADYAGDVIRIKQILSNLLSNAFKYTARGTVELSVRAEPSDAADGEEIELVFSVKDTGKGMTEEAVSQLFSEYTRFDESGSNRYIEGTGLGLNIVKNLVDLMGGEIAVESKPGEGSTFTARIPQKRLGDKTVGRETAENLRKMKLADSAQARGYTIVKEYMPYGSVLVVDDVETNLFAAEALLEPYGLKIETVLSAKAAIELAKNHVYDIIFMDHMMPEMDGIEAVKIIRGLGYNRAIIALTANAIVGHREMFLENGFDDFLAKPIDTRQLDFFLKKYVRVRSPKEEARPKPEEHKTKAFPAHGTLLSEMFVRDAEKLAALLAEIHANKYESKDDLASYIIYIHGVKAALANVGEAELSKIADRLETAGRAGKIDVLSEQTSTFLRMLSLVIKKHTPKEKKQDGGDKDIEALREGLRTIRDACDSFDTKKAREALKELRKKDWTGQVNKHLGEMSLQLLSGDLEAVIRSIEKIMNLS